MLSRSQTSEAASRVQRSKCCDCSNNYEDICPKEREINNFFIFIYSYRNCSLTSKTTSNILLVNLWQCLINLFSWYFWEYICICLKIFTYSDLNFAMPGQYMNEQSHMDRYLNAIQFLQTKHLLRNTYAFRLYMAAISIVKNRYFLFFCSFLYFFIFLFFCESVTSRAKAARILYHFTCS